MLATGDTGPDRVNASELAVLEDVARHPQSVVADVTARTESTPALSEQERKELLGHLDAALALLRRGAGRWSGAEGARLSRPGSARPAS